MPKLPQVSGKKLVKALERMGFVAERQTGSHVILVHIDGRKVTVPIHANRDIPTGTLHGILKDIEITADMLNGFL